MKNRFVAVVGLAALPVLAACEQNPMSTSAPTRFVAAIEGSVTASYEGTGWFYTTPAVVPRPVSFFLYSSGLGAAADHGFEFSSKARPEVGHYTLGDLPLGAEGAIHAVYTLREGNRVKRFAARAGEIEITTSSASRIEGTFHFSATVHSECVESRNGPSYSMSCSYLHPGPDAPQVEISGSFEAVAGRVGPARLH